MVSYCDCQYRAAKQVVSGSETGRIGARYDLFQNGVWLLKQAVSKLTGAVETDSFRPSETVCFRILERVETPGYA